MEIKNNKIYFNDKYFTINSTFEEVLAVVKNEKTYITKDNTGYAHIIIDNCEFYGIIMHCTIYFENNIVDDIQLTINWQLTDTKDMDIIKATEYVSDLNRTTIDNYFGIFEETPKSINFYADKLVIMTSISPYNDSYGVTIRKSTNKDKNMFKDYQNKGE